MTASVGEIRHLLSRTGFGVPRAAELDALTGLDYSDAVTQVLDSWQPRASQPDPEWLDSLSGTNLRFLTDDERQEIRRERRRQGSMAKAWWYAEMLATASPFTERMTLFWHNHFTSSLRKVKIPEMMYRQNQLLRTYALGNFADFLHAVSKDPAMLTYLDTIGSGVVSVVAAPKWASPLHTDQSSSRSPEISPIRDVGNSPRPLAMAATERLTAQTNTKSALPSRPKTSWWSRLWRNPMNIAKRPAANAVAVNCLKTRSHPSTYPALGVDPNEKDPPPP